MKIIATFLFFIGCYQYGCSQSLSGNWIGESQHKIALSNPKSILLEIDRLTDSSYTGILHINYKGKSFEHIKVFAQYDSNTQSFVLKEDSLISYRKNIFEESCLGINYLKVSFNDSSMIMSGVWHDKNRGLFKCPDLKVTFKKLTSIKSEIIKSPRIINVTKVIDISRREADSIKVELYDNGAIDNDSVSVYLNSKKVISNIRLTSLPQTFYLNLDKNIELNKLILFAINLGDIPPNTAYITIKTKKNTYSTLLSSNFDTNGAIEFQFVD